MKNENNMNHYFIKDEDGLFRMFDVSHDGLEDAIEVANDIGTDVMREHDDETELVWSFEKSGNSDDDEPSEDNFRDDAEADGDALASAGFGTDEDYGCFDSGDEDYGCEY
jgi:hypothetical protein